MKLKIFSLIVISLVSLGSFVVIFFNSNPEQGEMQISAFFLFMFLFISSFSALIYFMINRSAGVLELKFYETIRRSVLLALLICGSLMLKALSIFNLVSIFSYLLSLILVELYFSLKRNNAQRKDS